jgi:hypothetical protein
LEEKARKKTYIFKPPALWHFYTGADSNARLTKRPRQKTLTDGHFYSKFAETSEQQGLRAKTGKPIESFLFVCSARGRESK